MRFFPTKCDLLDCLPLLFYHKHTHNSIKFCLIFLCLIPLNHHLPCPFPLLCADCPRLTVANIGFRKRIGFRYLVLPYKGVYVGEVGNKRVKFPHNRLIPCVDGGGLFPCIVIDNCFLLISGKFYNSISPFPLLWVLRLFPSATVGCFACSFAFANLALMEWSRSAILRLLVVAVSSLQLVSDSAFNLSNVVLTIRALMRIRV